MQHLQQGQLPKHLCIGLEPIRTQVREQSPEHPHSTGRNILVCLVNRIPGTFISLEINFDYVFPRKGKLWLLMHNGNHHLISPNDVKLQYTV